MGPYPRRTSVCASLHITLSLSFVLILFSLSLSLTASRPLARSSLPFLPSPSAMTDKALTDTTTSSKVPIKLEGPTNYNTWCRYVTGALKLKKLAKHICAGPGSVRPADNDDKQEAWDGDDEQAQGIITLSVSPAVLTVLGDAQLSAKDMWDRLASHCRRQDMWLLIDLFRRLTNTRLLDASEAEKHLSLMSDLRTQFVNFGAAIPEWISSLLLLLSVPNDDQRWDTFLVTQTAAMAKWILAADRDNAPTVSWDSISTAILAEASRHTQQDAERARKQVDATSAAAYAAKAHGPPSGAGDNKRRGGGAPGYCTHCDRKGHVKDTCYTLHPHLREADMKRRAEARGYFCVVDTTDNGTALACQSDTVTHVQLTTDSTAGVWYVDSGASYSLTGDRTWFTELHSCSPRTITTANSGVLTCTQQGTVVLNVRYGCITVRDVLHVPSIAVNLLSVNALLQAGCRPHFTPTGCAVLRRDRLMAEIKLHNNVYPLVASRQRPATVALSTVATPATIHTTSTTLDWLTVHARLGHLNVRSIQQLLDKHMASGITVPVQGSPDDIKKCTDCIIGKAHRLPFPKQASTRSTRPLQLVHSDVCGPIDTVVRHSRNKHATVNVKRYILTFIDDYSRLLWIVITIDKSGATVMANFIRYKAWAERFTGFDIQCLRTDGGTEYVNNDFKTYLSIMGIDRQVTAAYTPEQNGVAERANRTILDTARSMLLAADLPMTFWTHAVKAAVYLRNRSPTRALNNVTPYEAWHGDKPNISHLRVFGCRAFMYLHRNKRGSDTAKLAARSIPVIFVGYSTEAKAWLVWDAASKKEYTTRDALFDEGPLRSSPLNQSAPAAEPTSSNDSDSASDQSADTEHSSSPDPLLPADDASDSDSDSEDEAAVQAVPVAAAEQPVAAVAEPAVIVEPVVQAASDQPPVNNDQPRAGINSSVAGASVRPIVQPKQRKPRYLTELQPYLRRGRVGLPDEQAALYYAAVAQTGSRATEPRSHKEAVSGPHRVQWEQAMQDELDSIKANHTYELVPLPAGRQAIGCKWVYKIKRHADGSIDRWKARLVAKGYSQLYGIDFTETFAPVVRFSSLRAILALAASADYEIHQMDVKTAFLNGDLDEDIYMQQPDGYRADGEKALWVWKLTKSLYGLKQAGRAWYQKMDAALTELGFTSLQSDSCVYIKREDNAVIYVLVYVDDLLLVTNDTSQLVATKDALATRFDMKDLGEARFLLGVQIRRDRAKRQLYLSQREYIRTILERFGMQDCKPTASPMATGVQLLKNGTADEPATSHPYASAVGALMYAALATRPDIAYVVTALCQFMSNPMVSHWNAVKRVFRYLQGSQDRELAYGVNSSQPELYGYSDSDWGNNTNDRRSVTGWVFLYHGGAVSWQSCKQRTVALSSVEAEYMAATQATREAVWWRAFFTELGLPPTAATVVHSDSQGAIALSKNPEHHKRTKHIDIQHHYVREQVEAGSVTLPHIGTESMVADVLTKPLAADRHNTLVGDMGVRATHNAV